jgi:hypothetical protein
VQYIEKELEFDPIWEEVTKDELELPTRRRLTFVPMQRQTATPCQDINATTGACTQWRTLLR